MPPGPARSTARRGGRARRLPAGRAHARCRPGEGGRSRGVALAARGAAQHHPEGGPLRHVVAMGGGGWMMDDPALDRAVLELTDARRPRICFVPTGSGDPPAAGRVLEDFPAHGFDASILWLFDRDVAEIDAFLGEQDIVYV